MRCSVSLVLRQNPRTDNGGNSRSAGRIRAVEPLEQLLQVFRDAAASGVGHGNRPSPFPVRRAGMLEPSYGALTVFFGRSRIR